MITRESEHIKVEGHGGTWYVIDEGSFVLTPDTPDGPQTIRAHLFLLEHEKYGDEAACVIVDEAGRLVLEDVWNGFGDLEEAGWAVDSKPAEGGPRLVRVTLADGNTITTRINGTDEEIRAYYRVGSTLNVGAVHDELVRIAAVEIVADGDKCP